MKETLNSPLLGPTAKKREVAQECRNVTAEKDGVLEKYYESLACVRKQFALWWRKTERQGIRNHIRDSKFGDECKWRQKSFVRAASTQQKPAVLTRNESTRLGAAVF